MVFNRGSSQNKDGQYLQSPFDLRSFGQVEKESHSFFTHMSQRLIDDYPNITYKAVSVHDFPGKYDPVGYKAAAVGWDSPSKLTNSANADVSLIPGDYRSSVYHGVQETTGYLREQIQKCPDQYYFVGGYSQGAQVMGDSLFALDSNEQSRILGVGLFGDPKYTGFYDGQSKFWRRGTATSAATGMLEPRVPYVPSDLEHRTVSWCFKKDIVCGSWPQFSKDSFHGTYSQAAIPSSSRELASFGAPQLRALETRRLGGDMAIPSTRMLQADRERQRDVLFLVNDNSNASTLNTFKYDLDPGLPSFDKDFVGTRYGAKTFGEHDFGTGVGNVPRVTHIQALTPLVGFNPSNPMFTRSNLNEAFGTKYAGTQFIVGGGDIADPYQLAVERAVATGNWRTSPDVERNIVMIVDRPPKETYTYNICSTYVRTGLKFTNVDSYNACYANLKPESWLTSEYPETCQTILKVMTLLTCDKQQTAPSLEVQRTRTHQDMIRLAHLNNVKLSIVVPYKIYDQLHPLNKQATLDQMKQLAESTGGIFINYNKNDKYTTALLQDTLYQVFTKQQRTPQMSVDGQAAVKQNNIASGTPVTLDAGQIQTSTAHSYQWDINGDGVTDIQSAGPVIDYTFEPTKEGVIIVKALAENGSLIGQTQLLYTSENPVAPDTSPLPLPVLTASQTALGQTEISRQDTSYSTVVIDPSTNLLVATLQPGESSVVISGKYSSLTARNMSTDTVSGQVTVSVTPYVPLPSIVIPLPPITFFPAIPVAPISPSEPVCLNNCDQSPSVPAPICADSCEETTEETEEPGISNQTPEVQSSEQVTSPTVQLAVASPLQSSSAANSQQVFAARLQLEPAASQQSVNVVDVPERQSSDVSPQVAGATVTRPEAVIQKQFNYLLLVIAVVIAVLSFGLYHRLSSPARG